VKQNTPTIPSNMTGSSTANDTLIGSAPRFDGTADFWRSVRPDRSLMPTYFFEYFSVRELNAASVSSRVITAFEVSYRSMAECCHLIVQVAQKTLVELKMIRVE
jgi:hypothetical protein